MKYDVIIIGSGLGGLECGHILAKKGMSVLILERQMQPGGCMQSYKRKGVAFDTGMHYVGGLGEGDCLYAPFKNLGLMDLPWQRLDPEGFDRVTIGDRTFSYAEGHEAFVETLAQDFPHQKEALKKYCGVMNDVGSHLYDALQPRDEVDFFTTSLFSTSAYGFLNDTFSDQLLLNALCGSSLKMELCKEKLPLYTFAQGNNSFIQSSWRLKGDGDLIVNKLMTDIRSMGGEIICNAEVEELIEKDGQLVAARCANGETYEANLFISNAHPAVTCSLVKESSKMKKVYKKRIGNLENTYGMFTLSLALKPETLKYFNFNQYIYKEADVWDYYTKPGPVSGILISCRCPEEGEYTQVIDIITPMPWEQIEQWSETTIGHRGEEYKEFKASKADECIALAEQFIPGLGSMIQDRYMSTPLTYRDYTLTPYGSAYGVRKDYHNPMMTLLSAKTPIPNLLLTGQSLTLHGLLGVTMSSLFTVAEVLGREEAWKLTQTD